MHVVGSKVDVIEFGLALFEQHDTYQSITGIWHRSCRAHLGPRALVRCHRFSVVDVTMMSVGWTGRKIMEFRTSVQAAYRLILWHR